MSGYQGDNPLDNNNDTFLSRVFGLHSVYNQLQDNYQYYDPEIDSTYQQEIQRQEDEDRDKEDELFSRAASVKVEEDVKPPKSSNANTLLDSESDLDLLSEESPPMDDDDDDENNLLHTQVSNELPHILQPPHLPPQKLARQRKSNQSPSNLSTYDESQDLLTSLHKPYPKRNLKFNIPNMKTARNFINKLNTKDPQLPLYETTTQFRKPANEPGKGSTGAGGGPSGYIGPNYNRSSTSASKFFIPPKERALYLWANITNMDEFLADVYYYYRGNGMLNIVLTRLVDLVILAFILSFSVFLKWGINYDYFQENLQVSTHITLKDLVIPSFLSTVPFSIKFVLLGFVGYIILRLIQLYFDFKYKLREIKNFYSQLIGISNDNELMTISWKVIVERLMLLKDYNSLTTSREPGNARNSNLGNRVDPQAIPGPSSSNQPSNVPNSNHYLNDLNSKVRLNAHDIANRIMRKENYMIALINKDILDFSLSFPNKMNLINSKSVLTRTLEWNLKLCINNFIFNQHGQINSSILKDFNRNQLAKELTSRFKMAAIINLLLCPFIVIYFLLLYFFRYFNEYKSNPSSLVGLRQYTPYAEWKLREFNELPHFFIKRLHLSIGPANTFINQFPRGFFIFNLMTLINFVLGAIMAILVLMGLWFDNEEHTFWSFELSEGKSSLFYISIFGTIWAVTSTSLTSSTSSENVNTNSQSFVYDPEASLRYVSQFTHYLPSSWNGRLHTLEVKNEFCELYSLKIIIILYELLSLILTPFILWFKVSNNSGAIIDFFREYSIHVDGLGYVCYFAMFNFEEKDKNMMYDNRVKGSKRRSRGKGKRNTDADIELDVISKRKEKSKISDHELSSSSDDSDLEIDYYQDEKMIKSYMYFLESYGGSKSQNPKAKSKFKNVPLKVLEIPVKMLEPVRGLMNPIIQSYIDPSPSLLYQGSVRGEGAPMVGRNGPFLRSDASSHQSLSESTYNIDYKFDDDIDFDKKSKKSGVLGMLNQFYKQDINR